MLFGAPADAQVNLLPKIGSLPSRASAALQKLRQRRLQRHDFIKKTRPKRGTATRFRAKAQLFQVWCRNYLSCPCQHPPFEGFVV